jgi:hypothetical protein
MAKLPPDKRRAWAAFLLGRAWFEKARDDIARGHLEDAVAQWPDLALPYRYLSYISLRAESYDEGLAYSARACKLDDEDRGLHWEYLQFEALAGKQQTVPLPGNPDGKLRFRQRYDRSHHRSGWQYAVDSLQPLHNPSGVLFESFLEDPFAWQQPHAGRRSGAQLLEFLLNPEQHGALNAEECGTIPFQEPWVGFMHNPPSMPAWLHPKEAPKTILDSDPWHRSMEHCLGLFTLSQYHATWLYEATGKPVSALLHPTQTPAQGFSFDAFVNNPDKKVVQVGWWLRCLSAIYQLPIPVDNALKYGKLRLVPDFGEGSGKRLAGILDEELERGASEINTGNSNTEELPHLGNEAYDELLSRNIVFIQLYDASANNTVVECLARATPLLVNPLPAVVEYLGPEYPFYYTDLEAAAALVMDLDRVRDTHSYLLEHPLRVKLTGEYFRQSLADSDVYALLEQYV